MGDMVFLRKFQCRFGFSGFLRLGMPSLLVLKIYLHCSTSPTFLFCAHLALGGLNFAAFASNI